jgi:Ciliary basal body-associated, B9 protein
MTVGEDAARHNIIGSGLSEPLKSCVWGIAVSGEIESFARPGFDLCAWNSFTVVMYDWAVQNGSPWKLEGAIEHPEELCWGQYLSVGPQATSLAKGYNLNVFNHPIDALVYSNNNDAVLEPLPKLVVQVVRIGAHGRQSLEGYGFLEIPSKGAHRVEIDLWAPPTTFGDRLVGIYKPLVSRLNAMDLIADKSAMVVRKSIGRLSVRMQVMTVRGRGRSVAPPQTTMAPESAATKPDTIPESPVGSTNARARRTRSKSENDPSTN